MRGFGKTGTFGWISKWTFVSFVPIGLTKRAVFSLTEENPRCASHIRRATTALPASRVAWLHARPGCHSPHPMKQMCRSVHERGVTPLGTEHMATRNTLGMLQEHLLIPLRGSCVAYRPAECATAALAHAAVAFEEPSRTEVVARLEGCILHRSRVSLGLQAAGHARRALRRHSRWARRVQPRSSQPHKPQHKRSRG